MRDDRDTLTARELEILRLIAAGRSNKQIGAHLRIARSTVSTHVSTILLKLGASNRAEAAVIAVRDGIIEAPAGHDGLRPSHRLLHTILRYKSLGRSHLFSVTWMPHHGHTFGADSLHGTIRTSRWKGEAMRKRVLAGVLLVALAGILSFGAGQLIREGMRTEAQQPVPPTLSADSILQPIKEEQQKPRFAGEILGLFLAPTEEEFPPEYRARRDPTCGFTSAPAGALDFPRPVALAQKWVPRDPDQFPMVFACKGSVTHVTYEYVTDGVGLPASIGIIRQVARGNTQNVAAERVVSTVVSGRPAVLIKPITPDGLGQTSEILFPEEFGMTNIYAFNLPETELLAIAAAVVEAGK